MHTERPNVVLYQFHNIQNIPHYPLLKHTMMELLGRSDLLKDDLHKKYPQNINVILIKNSEVVIESKN